MEEQAGLNTEKNKDILYEHRNVPDQESYEEAVKELRRPQGDAKDDSEGDDSEDSDEDEKMEESEDKPVQHAGAAFGFGTTATSAVGSGLKRPFSDISEIPLIKRRKKQTSLRERPAPVMDESGSSDEEMPTESEGEEDESEEGSDDEEEEFTGFSDSDKKDGKDGSEEDSGEEDDSEGSGSNEDDSDEEDDSSESEPEGNAKPGKSARANAFKEWASQQQKIVLGEEGELVSNIESVAANMHLEHVPRSRDEDMTPPPELFEKSVEREAFHVTLDRPVEVQESRLGLPVVAEEQRIMEAIHNNPCVVICGETGSGKTTQVPQFLYEAGYGTKNGPTPGLIGVTQPRRVAAVSMASRVGVELGKGGQEKVSYQIRFDGTVGPKTAIKFMTDGVLLRELANDFLLKKYSAIIIDEAHERSINTDILIGVMSRVLRLRAQLVREDPVKNKVNTKLMLANDGCKLTATASENDHHVRNAPSLRFRRQQNPLPNGASAPQGGCQTTSCYHSFPAQNTDRLR